MFHRRLFKVCAFFILAAANVSAHAELKIGVFDSRTILDNLPLVQTELQKLTAEFEPTQKEINDKGEALRALQEEINKNREILSPAELKQKTLDFQSKRRDLQLLVEDTDRLVNVRRNDVVRDLQATVEQEVVKYAEEEGYDLVLRSGVLYAGPKVDITQIILQRLSTQ